MPKRISQLATEPCSACGVLNFANWETCPQCKRNRRCAQIRESQKKRRRGPKKLEAARADRGADLNRRLREGECFPLLAFHVPSREWWLPSTRRQAPLKVDGTILPYALPALPELPADALCVVFPLLPYEVKSIEAGCSANHGTLTLKIRLALLTAMKQDIEGLGGRESIDRLVSYASRVGQLIEDFDGYLARVVEQTTLQPRSSPMQRLTKAFPPLTLFRPVEPALHVVATDCVGCHAHRQTNYTIDFDVRADGGFARSAKNEKSSRQRAQTRGVKLILYG